MKNAHRPELIISPYLRDIYDPEKVGATFEWLRRSIDARREEFDGLVFTGSSGAIALAVGISLGLPVTHVRKDLGHSYTPVEGAVVPRYAIVDDFVDTGATIERVVQRVTENHRDRLQEPPSFPLMFLYHSRTGTSDPISVRHVLNTHGIRAVMRARDY